MAQKKVVNQRTEVLKYMKQHRYITADIAGDKFGVRRIGTVISDLRKKYDIETVMVDGTTRYGTPVRYGRYYYRGVLENE